MKKFFCVFISVLLFLFGVSACTNNPNGGTEKPPSETEDGGTDTPDNAQISTGNEILVVYFSCTQTTEKIADYIIEKTGGARYEIQPKIPYTEDDLKYYTNGRADKEQADPTARPEIDGNVENMDKYKTVFIGYPIWHGEAPKIIYTFLESYDFSDKTLVPFCTSHSSGIGSSDTNLHFLAPDAEWKSGRRFAGNANKESVNDWVDGLDLKIETGKENMKFYFTVGDTVLAATLEDNPATAALKEKLKAAPITINMSDYGGFEKVGDLGFDLPTSNERVTTQPCDFVLYQGKQLVIFYGSNSWSYTRLGKITNVTPTELKNVLGNGSVSVTLLLSSVV